SFLIMLSWQVALGLVTQAGVITMGGVAVTDHFLQFVDINLFHVFHAGRPRTALQAQDAAHHLDKTLQKKEKAGNWNESLEGINRRAICSNVGMLLDEPGFLCIGITCPDQRHDTREEKQDIQCQVYAGLQARRKKTVE